MTNVKSLLEMYVKMGGSLTDTYSDIAGGVPVGQYSAISDAVLACSKKYSAGGGGGAEKFVVTLTEENDTWTADKTVAEIVAANAAGKIVVCNVPFEDYSASAEIPCWFAQEGFAAFEGIITFDNALIVEAQFLADGSSKEAFVKTTPIPTSTNEPLIVTLTAGATEGQFVGDKTYEEAFNAFVNGQNCVFYSPSVGLAETVKAAEHKSNYVVNTDSFTCEGSANDYITVTVGG